MLSSNISSPFVLTIGRDSNFGLVGVLFGASQVQIVWRVVVGTLILPLGFRRGITVFECVLVMEVIMSPMFISGLTGVTGFGTRMALLLRELMMSEILLELVMISGL